MCNLCPTGTVRNLFMNVRRPITAGALAGLTLGLAVLDVGAGGLQPLGLEFPLTRGIPGDQVNPSLALTSAGGLLAWQDAAIDGDGLGIAAVRLQPDLSAAAGAVFRINAATAGDQENVNLVPLADGNVFAVWQGGTGGFQRIYGRLLSASGQAIGEEQVLSAGDGEHQIDPAVAQLASGEILVAWSSYRQDGGYAYDVFARRLSAAGVPVGDEFRLNATVGMSRRSAALAALPDGRFVAGWIAEKQVGVRNASGSGISVSGAGAPTFEINLVTRPFKADGQAMGGEQVVSTLGTIAANPVLAGLPDGRIIAAWTKSQKAFVGAGMDVAARVLNGAGVPAAPEQQVNVYTVGDQFRPKLAVTDYGVFALWSSMGQDGSWEGVYGRWLSGQGVPEGDDLLVNSQTGGGQVFPAVSERSGREVLVVWSSNLPRTGYELFGQRLSPLMLTANAVGDGTLSLEWPTVAGAVYQLQSSVNGVTWFRLGEPRTGTGETASVVVNASGQLLLYRVVRVQ